MVTGFGKNARNILLALHQDPNIEVFEAANGINYGTQLLTPWKSYGTLNQDPNVLQQIQGDALKERYNAYGGYAIDEIVEDGYTKEEWKMENETKKILSEKIKVSATCVRVRVIT